MFESEILSQAVCMGFPGCCSAMALAAVATFTCKMKTNDPVMYLKQANHLTFYIFLFYPV